MIHIIEFTIFPSYLQGGSKEQRSWKYKQHILHNELDSLVREFILQLVEGHELIEFISRLKPQLLDIDGWLALVHGTWLRLRTGDCNSANQL